MDILLFFAILNLRLIHLAATHPYLYLMLSHTLVIILPPPSLFSPSLYSSCILPSNIFFACLTPSSPICFRNRIALLQKEEERARKKIEKTKTRAVEILALRDENERRIKDWIAASTGRSYIESKYPMLLN